MFTELYIYETFLKKHKIKEALDGECECECDKVVVADKNEEKVCDGNCKSFFSNLRIFMTVSSLLAGYLSWSSNSCYSIPARIIFALFAAFFGFTYLVLYIIFRWPDSCQRISETVKAVSSTTQK